MVNEIRPFAAVHPYEADKGGKFRKRIEAAAGNFKWNETEPRIANDVRALTDAGHDAHVMPGTPGGNAEREPMRHEVVVLCDEEQELTQRESAACHA